MPISPTVEFGCPLDSEELALLSKFKHFLHEDVEYDSATETSSDSNKFDEPMDPNIMERTSFGAEPGIMGYGESIDESTEINEIVKHEGSEWFVFNHDGTKKLSKGYHSKEEADKRLGQIEYFKNLQEQYSNDDEPYYTDPRKVDMKEHIKKVLNKYSIPTLKVMRKTLGEHASQSGDQWWSYKTKGFKKNVTEDLVDPNIGEHFAGL